MLQEILPCHYRNRLDNYRYKKNNISDIPYFQMSVGIITNLIICAIDKEDFENEKVRNV